MGRTEIDLFGLAHVKVNFIPVCFDINNTTQGSSYSPKEILVSHLQKNLHSPTNTHKVAIWSRYFSPYLLAFLGRKQPVDCK